MPGRTEREQAERFTMAADSTWLMRGTNRRNEHKRPPLKNEIENLKIKTQKKEGRGKRESTHYDIMEVTDWLYQYRKKGTKKGWGKKE